MFHWTLSFRASSKVLRSFLLLGAGLIAWVPHFTTGIGWALRVGFYRLQQAQRHLDEPWVGMADFTMQMGSKKALIVLRVPVAALRMGKALTLQQVEVIGLRLGETWNGALCSTLGTRGYSATQRSRLESGRVARPRSGCRTSD